MDTTENLCCYIIPVLVSQQNKGHFIGLSVKRIRHNVLPEYSVTTGDGVVKQGLGDISGKSERDKIAIFQAH